MQTLIKTSNCEIKSQIYILCILSNFKINLNSDFCEMKSHNYLINFFKSYDRNELP